MTGPGSSDDGEAEGPPTRGTGAGGRDTGEPKGAGADGAAAQAADSPVENNVVRVDFGRSAAGPKGKGAPRGRQKVRDGISRETLDAEPHAKLEAFTRLVGEGMVLVTLDARAVGVSVPPRFRGDFQLALNFSVRFQRPDFVFDVAGVRATLTFQHEPFFCDVPWGAVYMLRSHVTNELVLFPGSLPTEFLETLPPAARARIEAARGQMSGAPRLKPADRAADLRAQEERAAPPPPASAADRAPDPAPDRAPDPVADAPPVRPEVNAHGTGAVAPQAPAPAAAPAAADGRPRPMLRLVKSEPPRRS